jgi:hypothetical protein
MRLKELRKIKYKKHTKTLRKRREEKRSEEMRREEKSREEKRREEKRRETLRLWREGQKIYLLSRFPDSARPSCR